MKINYKYQNVETDISAEDHANFSIHDIRKMVSMFTDNTYSNKPLAVVRELYANAVDSHIEAGKADVPVFVKLPSQLDPTFKIQDFGVGMSDEFMMNQFPSFSFSTKNTSNTLTGGLGIGSKVFLSYNERTGLLEVNYDGMKRLYSVYMKEDGMPAIVRMGSAIPTDECNGVTVTVPVNKNDIHDFRSTCSKFFKFVQSKYKFNEESFDTETPEPVQTGEPRWGRYAQYALPSNNSYARMGDILYRIDFSAFKHRFTLNQVSYLNDKMLFDFDIGELSIHTSREQLSYDEQTAKAINDRCSAILDKIQQKAQADIDACSNLREAVQVEANFDYALRRLLKRDDLTYKNKFLRDQRHLNFLHQKARGIVEACDYMHYQLSNNKTLNSKWINTVKTNYANSKVINYHESITTSPVCYILGLTTDKKWPSTVLNYFQNVANSSPNGVTCFRAEDMKGLRDFYDYLIEIGYKDDEIIWFKDMPEPPKAVRTSSGKTINRKVMKRLYTSSYKIENQGWVDVEDDFDPETITDTTYYIRTKANHPHPDCKFSGWYDVSKAIEALKKLGYKLDYVYIVTSGGKNPVADLSNWIELDSIIDGIIDDIEAKYSKQLHKRGRLADEYADVIYRNLPSELETMCEEMPNEMSKFPIYKWWDRMNKFRKIAGLATYGFGTPYSALTSSIHRSRNITPDKVTLQHRSDKLRQRLKKDIRFLERVNWSWMNDEFKLEMLEKLS